MAIKSMTGFARSDGGLGSVSWHWEVRTVNGRGLDVRLRLPPGYDALEPRVRELIAKRIVRGSITVSLSVSDAQSASQIRLNEVALAQVLAAAERVGQLTGGGKVSSVDGLLGLRGVLEVVESTEDDVTREARFSAVLAGLETALTGVIASRAAEGNRLHDVLAGQINEVAKLTAYIATSPSRTPEAIKIRLKEQITRLLDASQSFDPVRLHQEAVLMATRIDIEEELKRLQAHVAAAYDLLGATEPVGRKLDFLTQEFNREANTICSKANDGDIQRSGLALKAVIDQLREQVQNIE